ncbi:DUF3019 domain-containing protein [Rheinheimera soli]|uniref:DUF3019 domain-containing protein n=1 Tax=Rheinheimera soli TaxID=443616 RepID=A0ABU1W4G9_9GAMM|nr:DUF3019 domain-containing protein [Rheinheimera soli]MDR7122792.1 hypothetical protein [Rheinheimera soli]
MMVRCSVVIQLFSLALVCAAEAAPAELALKLIPQTCVVTEQQPQCQIKARLLVTGGEHQLLCLYQDTTQHSCQWHLPGQTTVFTLEVDADSNLPLRLKTPQGQAIATTTLQLVQFQGAHKRHKRGYLWNML